MRLGAFTLLVPDYDRALAFYGNALGFALVEDIAQGDKRWVTLEAAPGLRIVLAQPRGPAQIAALANPCGGRVWLFLQTEDFARDAARVQAHGGQFEEEPRHEAYGIVAVWRDPFGHRWDLIQPA